MRRLRLRFERDIDFDFGAAGAGAGHALAGRGVARRQVEPLEARQPHHAAGLAAAAALRVALGTHHVAKERADVHVLELAHLVELLEAGQLAQKAPAHRAELLHHPAHHVELLDDLLDLLHGLARTARDPSQPVGLARQRVRVVRSLSVIDWMIARIAPARGRRGSRRRACPAAEEGHHLHELAHRAQLRDLLELVVEVVEVELAREHPHRVFSARSASSSESVFSKRSIRPMTSPNPRIRLASPSGRNASRSSSFLAGTDELDRLAGHFLDRQGGATAGVAVELGHDEAVDSRAAR